MGNIKDGKGTPIGNAGEYLVVGELLKRDVIAALAPRNNPGFDVLVTNGIKSLNIRVKTKTPAANSWVWNIKKDGTLFANLRAELDFTIAVDLKDKQTSPDYYVIPTTELDTELKRIFELWLNSTPKRGKPHNPANRMRRIGDSEYQRKWLSQWKAAWPLIISELEAKS